MNAGDFMATVCKALDIDHTKNYLARGGRPMADLIGELVAALQDRFEGSREPIGLLGHHLVHDAAAWDFLGELFEATAGHPAVEWVSATALVRDQMSTT